MENQSKRSNKALQVSQLIGEAIHIPGKPERPRKPSSYEHLKKHDPEHRLVKEYDAAVKVFEDYWNEVEKSIPRPIHEPAAPLKKLVEVNIKSLYALFLHKYYEVTGVTFDSNANDSEGKLLVFTLLYYFFRDERFLNSPLLNKEINQPDGSKGVLVVGGYGCGKTSIFKAIRKMFFDAVKDPEIKVLDVDGDKVSLARYRRIFGYYTTNEVVQMYEATKEPEEKDRFWNIFNKGEIYFDDLMTERIASNYGKVELFKDILENRYDKKVRTLASCNYEGENVNQTLTAIGTRYGARVYDRLFEMFNIIELKGKSLRK